MRVDFTDLSAKDAFGELVQSLPIQDIDFMLLKDFLKDEDFSNTTTFKEVLASLGQERCHHCSYPRSPFSSLTGVRMSGDKDDVEKLSKLPKAENLVPIFVFYESCNLAQLQGIKPLCDSCFGVFISLIGCLSKGSSFTESRAWSNIIIPCFNQEYEAETSELTAIAESYIERYNKVSSSGISWDLTYLYNRGLIDDRVVHTAPVSNDTKPQENGKSEGKGETRTHDQVKEKFRKDAEQKKQDAINKAMKAADERSIEAVKKAKEASSVAWSGLNDHLSRQNTPDEIYAKVADDAYDLEAGDESPDYAETSTMRTVDDDPIEHEKDSENNQGEKGSGSDGVAVDDDPDDIGDWRSVEQSMREEADKESQPTHDVQAGAEHKSKERKNNTDSKSLYTQSHEPVDDRGVPGSDEK